MIRPAAICLAGAAAGGMAHADTLVLPAPVLARDQPVELVYHLDSAASGAGVLHLDWTDNFGRLVERRDIPVSLAGGTTVVVPFDPSRAVSVCNQLRARLSLGGADREAGTGFVVPIPDQGWWDYQIIMWQGQAAAAHAALRRLGVTAGVVPANRSPLTPAAFAALVDPLLRTNGRWYVENIATDFYATYHRWTADRPMNWLFDQVRAAYRRNPSDPTVFLRQPSLSDPAWWERIAARLQAHVRLHGPYRPLFYNLGDETGIANLASAWDYDFSPPSLAGMRDWLRLQYGTLERLNRQWNTQFADWDAVVPITTDAALARNDRNFSAWGDFKAWMDIAFATAVRTGTAALHAADPTARAGLEGTQVPGWGGYDYGLLAPAVDVMEVYDDANSLELAHALNPDLILLTTSFRSDTQGLHEIWRALLRGTRGLILWDSAGDFVRPDGTPGPRGEAMAAPFAELRGGLGAQLIAAAPVRDPVAILYSQASFRMRWLLDRATEWRSWARRGSSIESGQDNAWRAAMRDAAQVLVHQGLQPAWLSSGMVEAGALRRDGLRLLVLPHAIALSPAEAAEIAGFAARGGVVVADTTPGLFDAHGRRTAPPLLAGQPVQLVAGFTRASLAGPLRRAGLDAGFTLTRPDGTAVDDVEIRVFRNGEVTILGLQRDLQTQLATAANEVVLTLARPSHVHDTRYPGPAVRTDRLSLALDPVTPTLLTLAPAPLPAPALTGPVRIRAGETAELHIGLAGPTPAETHVMHIDVLDPAGQAVATYGGNVAVRNGAAVWQLPTALNDRTGQWTVLATDRLDGRSGSWTIEIQAAPDSASR